MHMCAWPMHLCDITHHSFTCVTWLISNSYVWHTSFICMTCLIYTCDSTHSYVWHDLCIPPIASRKGRTNQQHALQHTATHCSTLQHTAAHCNTLQHTAAHYNILQHTATHCSTLQHTATYLRSPEGKGARTSDTLYFSPRNEPTKGLISVKFARACVSMHTLVIVTHFKKSWHFSPDNEPSAKFARACVWICTLVDFAHMGWLRLVDSLKL